MKPNLILYFHFFITFYYRRISSHARKYAIYIKKINAFQNATSRYFVPFSVVKVEGENFLSIKLKFTIFCCNFVSRFYKCAKQYRKVFEKKNYKEVNA